MDRKARILVVDDDVINIEILKNILHPQYKVLASTNGHVALEIARAEPVPDIILLDIIMPELNGIDVCKKLKKDRRTMNIPVIFISTENETSEQQLGFSVGAVDYISKPFIADLVLARIEIHVELYNHRKRLEQLVNERTQDLMETTLEILLSLSRAAEFKDFDTGNHIIRMSNYSKLIAEHAGLNQDESEIISLTAQMHDIGKIGIPDRILNKPEKLDDTEWEIMKTHTKIGADILGGHSSDIIRSAVQAALTHHEKYDGSGYPDGLAGEEIPIIGRIISIADVFDALTSDRPYKKAWSFDQAVEEIHRCSGTSFDPKMVIAFDNALPEIIKIKNVLF